jgi:hypothetical protein
MEAVEFLTIGAQIIIVGHQRAKARVSGVPVEMTFAQVWSGDPTTLKLTSMRMFESRDEAIAVAEAEAAVPG